MSRRVLAGYLSCAAAIAVPFPGGVLQITETGDMIELASPLWLDPRDIDFVTRIESKRTIREVQVAELEAGSSGGASPPFEWFQPLSEPVSRRTMIGHIPTGSVEPLIPLRAAA